PFYGGGFAVFLDGPGTVVNTGTITTTGGEFGDGVFAASAAVTVINSGTISAPGHYGLGVYLHLGGSVANNAGYIEGYSGVRITGAAGAVSNTGTINGIGPTGGLGVELFAGGSVDNAAGLIEGNAGGVFIGGGPG